MTEQPEEALARRRRELVPHLRRSGYCGRGGSGLEARVDIGRPRFPSDRHALPAVSEPALQAGAVRQRQWWQVRGQILLFER
ncbi:MAG: hypothetical protein M3R24_30010 [Chloroflexota bacterium]|nr:hypothetical protein [Chloroflexota bacterium]